METGVLNKINDFQWGAPTLITPKKNGTVKFITYFKGSNERIKR